MIVDRRAPRAALIAALALVLAAPMLPASAAPVVPAVDLRVDANRDGITDVTATGSADEDGEERPTALFLPNLDDDTDRCAERDAKGKLLPDAVLARCNDAADGVVNGPLDARDLARVRTVPAPDMPEGAVGRLQFTDSTKINIFVLRAGGWVRVTGTTRFTAAELRAGLEFGVEGRDIVRHIPDWDGSVTLIFSVTRSGRTTSDLARMTVAPMLSHTPVQRPERVLVVSPASLPPSVRPEQRRFNAELSAAVTKSGVSGGVREFGTLDYDTWMQDYLEPMYASMPVPGGIASMRLLLRSDQDRRAGAGLYRYRGRDSGVVWPGPGAGFNTRDSFGNLETIPAHSFGGRNFPAGRLVYGTGIPQGDNMSVRMLRILRSQRAQAPLALDTSFLYVGHVDEMMQFLPADTPRGWRVAISDPRAGVALLRKAKAAGRGAATVINRRGEKLTVDQALRRGAAGILLENERSAKIIDANLAIIKANTGITDAEVVRVPGLYVDVAKLQDAAVAATGPTAQGEKPAGPSVKNIVEAAGGTLGAQAKKASAAPPQQVLALVPGAINSIVLGRSVIVPKQFSVKVDGRDVFADAVAAAYRKAGMTPRFIDGWSYHELQGEVHCATNVLRDRNIKWW